MHLHITICSQQSWEQIQYKQGKKSFSPHIQPTIEVGKIFHRIDPAEAGPAGVHGTSAGLQDKVLVAQKQHKNMDGFFAPFQNYLNF